MNSDRANLLNGDKTTEIPGLKKIKKKFLDDWIRSNEDGVVDIMMES